jgi:branched-chain amino acid transport system substrate-binding protein
MAVMVRDGRAEGLPLTFLGGEAMMAADTTAPLPDGTQAIVLPTDGATPEATAVVAAMQEGGIVAEGYVLPAHAAVTILGRATTEEASARLALADVLVRDTHPTVLGTIGFGAGHELRDNPYRLMEWSGGRFIPVPDASD